MENREIAIQLSGVKKMYKLGQIGGGTLTADLQSWWARVRGREDPNTKIGTNQRLIGQTFMALNGIDLTVYKGEALGIIGSNGAGKSTMLKLLSQVTAPTAGTIRLNGRVASMLEVGTGFHGEMTGRENVYLNGAILGMSKAEIDAKMEDIIEFSEVRDFIDTPVKRYSSGMYVKLAFSVAAHLDSEIMIMDEVLAVGDMKFQQKCLGRMGDAAEKEGRTVLYVSHNMNTIRQLCTRCIVLDKGKIIFDGNVDDAIAVYMENSADLCAVNECDAPRNYVDIDENIHIDRVSFLDRESYPLFSADESIRVKIDFTAKKNINNLAFRIAIQSLDKTRVGLATTKPCINAVTGKNNIVIDIPHSWLAPGKYGSFLVAYSVNDFGTDLIHDRVENAIAFEKVLNKDEMNRLTWQHSTWGHMMIPEVKVLENVYEYSNRNMDNV